jgi:hypothetical protein
MAGYPDLGGRRLTWVSRSIANSALEPTLLPQINPSLVKGASRARKKSASLRLSECLEGLTGSRTYDFLGQPLDLLAILHHLLGTLSPFLFILSTSSSGNYLIALPLLQCYWLSGPS